MTSLLKTRFLLSLCSGVALVAGAGVAAFARPNHLLPQYQVLGQATQSAQSTDTAVTASATTAIPASATPSSGSGATMSAQTGLQPPQHRPRLCSPERHACGVFSRRPRWPAAPPPMAPPGLRAGLMRQQVCRLCGRMRPLARLARWRMAACSSRTKIAQTALRGWMPPGQ